LNTVEHQNGVQWRWSYCRPQKVPVVSSDKWPIEFCH